MMIGDWESIAIYSRIQCAPTVARSTVDADKGTDGKAQAGRGLIPG